MTELGIHTYAQYLLVGATRSKISLPKHFVYSDQGFRSLDDIRAKASLTSQQAIGLKHYEDFLKRMPREEAAEIEQTVSTPVLCEPWQGLYSHMIHFIRATYYLE